MKKFFVMPVLAALVLMAASCDNDIDTNADWKEILVVYGLINHEDSAHYVRVNRAFLSENQSALEIAKINDSLYFDSVEVTVEEYSGAALRQSFKLERVVLQKDTGIFANYPNYIYKFNAKLDSVADYTYKLIVYNKLSKTYTTAKTQLVGEPGFLSPSGVTTNFHIDTAKNTFITWTGGRYAKVYDVTMRFYWDEYDSATNQLLDSNRYIDWPMVQNREVPNTGTFRSSVAGDNFYRFLADHIPGVIGKYRRAKKMDFVYWAGDNEFYLYQSVNRPGVGLVQKKPEYTNISGGNLGLFASRNSAKLANITISPQTRTFLQVYSLTRHLKFRQ